MLTLSKCNIAHVNSSAIMEASLSEYKCVVDGVVHFIGQQRSRVHYYIIYYIGIDKASRRMVDA